MKNKEIREHLSLGSRDLASILSLLMFCAVQEREKIPANMHDDWAR